MKVVLVSDGGEGGEYRKNNQSSSRSGRKSNIFIKNAKHKKRQNMYNKEDS